MEIKLSQEDYVNIVREIKCEIKSSMPNGYGSPDLILTVSKAKKLGHAIGTNELYEIINPKSPQIPVRRVKGGAIQFLQSDLINWFKNQTKGGTHETNTY